jgi:mono/diheme cytochrome c family protein
VTWKAVVVGFFVGLCALPALAFLYLRLGYAPVATSASPMPFEKYFARAALHARMNREAPRDDPPQPTEANLMSAAREYRRDCAVCHGLPGQPKTATAKGMFPKPPQLFQGKGVTDDSAGETYWKVKNGIRLTGMPSYEGSLTDEQMWRVSELLATADKLPQSCGPGGNPGSNEQGNFALARAIVEHWTSHARQAMVVRFLVPSCPSQSLISVAAIHCLVASCPAKGQARPRRRDCEVIANRAEPGKSKSKESMPWRNAKSPPSSVCNSGG